MRKKRYYSTFEGKPEGIAADPLLITSAIMTCDMLPAYSRSRSPKV